MRPRTRNDFKTAIICALAREFDAVQASFDEHYDRAAYGKQHGDVNFYRTGRIGNHNVVLACLPEMGKRNAASVVSTLKLSFLKIDLALLVGICGGVPFPSPNTELISGDVIISAKVVEYDNGKQYPQGFHIRDGYIETLDRADRRGIRTFLAALSTQEIRLEFQARHLIHLGHLQSLDSKWRYPGAAKDRLFETAYCHKHQNQAAMATSLCPECDIGEDSVCASAIETDCHEVGCTGDLIYRKRLMNCDVPPQIHFGTLGSGDTVMKSGEHREKLAKKAKLVGFEMEGMGICDNLSCLIIKGVSDYADSHKNKFWQDYAAATAASCTKTFLEALSSNMKQDEETIGPSVATPQQEDSLNRALTDATSLYSNSSTNGQAGYHWNVSSMASSIDNLDSHITSLKEELRRFENSIPNPWLRNVLVSGVTQAVKSHSETFRSFKTTKSFKSSSYKTRFGKIVSQTRVTKRSVMIRGDSSTRYKRTTSFIFHPASWLIRIGIKYGLSVISRTGWKYSILPVRAVDDDSLIFRFCKTGNVDAVRELFGLGSASVLDIDSKGWRPLHFATSHGNFEMAKFLILQDADKTAHVYESIYHDRFTPVALINACSQFPKATTTSLLDLFHDCLDFSEPTSEGWRVLAATDCDDRNDTPGRPGMHDIISFLFCNFRTEMTEHCNLEGISYALDFALFRSDTDSVRLLLELDSRAAYKCCLGQEPVIFTVASFPYISTDILKILIDKGADTHVIYLQETATSLSLHYSNSFFAWRDRLRAIYGDLDNFITREVSPTSVLFRARWRLHTLQNLFSLEPNQAFEKYHANYDYNPNIQCCECSKQGQIWYSERSIVEPWWEEMKYRIRLQQCICSLLLHHGCEEHGGTLTMFDVGKCKSDEENADLSVRSLGRFCREPIQECTYTNTDNHQKTSNSSDHNSVVDSDDHFDFDQCHYPWKDARSLLPKLFILQGEEWNQEYRPGEYYCFKCLADMEGWKLEGNYFFDEDSSDMMSTSSGEPKDDFDTETSDEEMSDADDHDEASCS